MKTKRRKPSGRPRRNSSDANVITDRTKLLALKNLVIELLTDYQITNNNLAKWTLGKGRAGYLSDIRHGRHLSVRPSIRPTEGDFEALKRFREFIRSQEGLSGEIRELMFERYGLQGQIAELDVKIFRALKRLALK